jgi:hypothetical protein
VTDDVISLIERKVTIAHLRAFETCMALVEGLIIDARAVLERTTVLHELQEWRRYIGRLEKLKQSMADEALRED